MNKNTVRFTVDLTIHEGKFDEFERIAQAMVASTQKETGAQGYDFYLSADRRRCRLLETYADANTVLAHLNGPTVRELVPKLLETAGLDRFEVYGDPGPESARTLTAFGAQIFALWRGLNR